jgi:prophage regulatory protein
VSATSSVRRIIRYPELRQICSRGRTTIWRLENAGQFPRRVQLGQNSVGWYLDEVIAYLDSLPRAGSSATDDQ